MKNKLVLFFFVFLSTASLYAGSAASGGPRSPRPDTPDKVWQNDLDLHDEIKDKTAILSTGTKGQVFVSNGSGQQGSWSSQIHGSILQMSQTRISVSSVTTSLIYIPSNVTASITPLQSGSTIFIMVTGSCQNNNVSTAKGTFTIYRNSTTDLDTTGTGNGFTTFDGATTAVQLETPCSIITIDAPGTTSATTYTVYMKRTGAGNNIGIPATGGTATVILVEVGT